MGIRGNAIEWTSLNKNNNIFDNFCQIHDNCCSSQTPLADKTSSFKLFLLSFIISNQ